MGLRRQHTRHRAHGDHDALGASARGQYTTGLECIVEGLHLEGLVACLERTTSLWHIEGRRRVRHESRLGHEQQHDQERWRCDSHTER